MSNFPSFADLQPPATERGLPVYLLLDTSGSMQGAAIQSLQSALEHFQREVMDEPTTRDVVKVGIITFGSNAEMVTPGLVKITELQPVNLTASGTTRLDLAFICLLESLDRDVMKPIKGGQKGDWKPFVFVLTDGRPDDSDWTTARNSLLQRPKGSIRPASIVAVGCGPDIDNATLQNISTGTAFRMGTESVAFVALFELMTQSITASVQEGQNIDEAMANFELPPDVDLVRIV